MGSTLTTFTALLKERYVDSSRIEELTYPDNVLLAMLEKKGDTGMVGLDMVVPILYSNPQGLAGIFATAQTNATNISAAKWAITAGEYYGVVQIGDKVLQASRTNQGAFLDNKVTEIDGLYEQAGENLSVYLWGNGGQAIGQIAAINSNDIILTDFSNAAQFENGMTVSASANDGSDVSHALRTGSTTVTGVNRSTGDITLANAAGITSLAVGDFLFRNGDFFGNVGTTVIKGVQAFVTATDTPPTLWGVTNTTRATDPQRFAGCRVNPNDVIGRPLDERIRLLIAQITGRFKGKVPTAGFLHPEDFEVLATLMTSRGIRPLEDENTQFGFAKINVATAAGNLPIYTDRHCPKGNFFALRMDDWWISSMGELLHPQTGDGLEILRRATSTDYEFRLISYPLLANRAPKNSGRVSLT